ncbi:MAG: aldo/keto reductase [Crocosphaera sp.]|nr:aldo/keto reductase [Crocosphaera sp.]
MEANKLKVRNIDLPTLGIGTWAWGDSLFWGYGSNYGEKEVKDAFEAAIREGVTFFDTAEVYGLGQSEKLLGKFLKQTSQPVQIATKYFPLPWRFNGEAVVNALTASLERLDVQQIALYQVHMPFDFFMGQKTLMKALATEVKRGRILTIGVSNYSATQMQQAHELLAEYDVPLAVNQVRYSLLTRQIEKNGILEKARQLGVTILAYSPLAQGLLTGKYTSNKEVTGARKLDSKFSDSGLKQIEPLISQLKQLGEKYGKTTTQVALNWLIAQGNVIPIPGAKNARQAIENAGAMGWQLNDEDVKQLSSL